jgi:hypothetical protein
VLSTMQCSGISNGVSSFTLLFEGDCGVFFHGRRRYVKNLRVVDVFVECLLITKQLIHRPLRQRRHHQEQQGQSHQTILEPFIVNGNESNDRLK